MKTTSKGCYLLLLGPLQRLPMHSLNQETPPAPIKLLPVTFLPKHVPTRALNISISFEIKLTPQAGIHNESLSPHFLWSFSIGSPFIQHVFTIWGSPIYWPSYLSFFWEHCTCPHTTDREVSCNINILNTDKCSHQISCQHSRECPTYALSSLSDTPHLLLFSHTNNF